MTAKPAKPATKETANDNSEAARRARVAQERAANDPDHVPTDKDVQIDGSGARFKSDG